MKHLLILVFSIAFVCQGAFAETSNLAAKAVHKPSDEEVSAIKQKYQALVLKNYEAVLQSNQELLKKAQDLVKAPSAASMNAAKDAWKKARVVYSPTEPYRYYGGPIDDAEKGVEGLMNAWPIDEAYLDYVKGNAKTGLVSDTKALPIVSKTALIELNEKGGERNVSTGYHAIEFLLWGQDFSLTGPGERPFSDYSPTDETNRRRGQVLVALCELLVDHSQFLVKSWQPQSGYVQKFMAEPSEEFLRKILVGVTSLSADEMGGERLTVALEKNDPEHEQDCFSDFSVEDLKANQAGIEEIYTKTGLKELFEKHAKASAQTVAKEMQNIKKSLDKIKVPIDTLISDKKAKGRKDIQATIGHLQKQSQAIAKIAHAWNIELNVQSE